MDERASFLLAAAPTAGDIFAHSEKELTFQFVVGRRHNVYLLSGLCQLDCGYNTHPSCPRSFVSGILFLNPLLFFYEQLTD